MDSDEVIERCLSFPGTESDFPFGPDTMTIRVSGKIFAFVPVAASRATVSLKGDPDDNVELRRTFPSVEGAYHLNKRHWNGVPLDGSVPDDEIQFLIEQSFRLVAAGLTRRSRVELGIE
ncbi:MAG: MmcQ/YjbR family DNA-binding protein [Actinomycetia bacterium]|nr:MmcQ/YjbR family DNA-binding protein [Actinomycetes bacterium]